MKLLLLIAAAGAVLPASPIELAHQGPIQEEMHWHGWIPGGQVIEINNVLGNIRAEESSGDEVEVIARKRGSDDPKQVSIEVVEHKGGVTICAVYPNANPEHPFECRPSHGGGFRVAATTDSEARIRWDNGGGGDVLLNNVSVDFLVRVPKRLRLIARTVDGEVSAQLPDEDMEAHSIHGDLSVDMNPSGADVRAETAMGEVNSEFPLIIKEDPNHGVSASGRIGHAHRTLRLTTADGNIHLHRLQQPF